MKVMNFNLLEPLGFIKHSDGSYHLETDQDEIVVYSHGIIEVEVYGEETTLYLSEATLDKIKELVLLNVFV